MSRPVETPTTGKFSGSPLYTDGSVISDEGILQAQIVDQTGAAVDAKNVSGGEYSFEVSTAGVYTVNIIKIETGEIIGNLQITINIGDNLTGQNVATNWELIYTHLIGDK